jgi:hypothetical protein
VIFTSVFCASIAVVPVIEMELPGSDSDGRATTAMGVGPPVCAGGRSTATAAGTNPNVTITAANPAASLALGEVIAFLRKSQTRGRRLHAAHNLGG